MERKIRVLLGKLGEGHKGASLNLAKRLGGAGFEVIYTELQDPGAIARSALQESVDHIGITTLPGADVEVFEKIRMILKNEGVEEITLTAGGILEEGDILRIKEMGVMEFFPAGTSFEEMLEWSKKNIKPKRHEV
ncbi:MAG: methylmalonyl-CoA mutase [Pseudomonadota bacterium]